MVLSALEAAALNNALWCASIFRALGRSAHFAPTLWWAVDPAPPFYPRAVTLQRDLDAAAWQRLRRLQPGDAVKDSFACLDLEADGFDLLFEARWFYRAARSAEAIESVETEADLARWVTAWGEDTSAPIFAPPLLQDPTVQLLWLREGGHVLGGAAVNEGAGLTGVTNLFGDKQRALSALAGPLVTYAEGAEAALLETAGFTALGPLRVWLRR